MMEGIRDGSLNVPALPTIKKPHYLPLVIYYASNIFKGLKEWPKYIYHLRETMSSTKQKNVRTSYAGDLWVLQIPNQISMLDIA